MSAEASPPTLAGVRWRLRAGEDPGLHAERIAGIERALAAGEARNTKSGRRKELYPIAGPGGGVAFLLKRNRYGAGDALRRVGRGSKSRHELRLAQALADRGLPAVVPLAAGERRRGLRLAECWLLVPYLTGARDLLALAREPGLAPAQRRSLARELGALSRAAHDAGLLQDDFAPNNFLHVPGATPALHLIDFERARLSPRPASDAWRGWMLAKLERALPGASASQRFRFLLAYTQGDRDAARRWWQAVERASVRLARRDAARWRRIASADGRRFRVVSLPGMRGFARRELDDAALLAVLERGGRGLLRWPDPGARALARLWGDAQALAARGLGLPWLACVARGEDAFLVGAGDRLDPADEVAVRLLLRRLLRLGKLDPAQLAPDSFVRAPGPAPGRAPGGAVLTDPRAFQFATRERGADPSAEARALARRLHPTPAGADSVAPATLR